LLSAFATQALPVEVIAVATGRLFKMGSYQAFWLSKGIRFRGLAVEIFRREDKVILYDLAPEAKRHAAAKRGRRASRKSAIRCRRVTLRSRADF